ncbi:unnamed protein product, partial [Hapterophycus canaliculatus]
GVIPCPTCHKQAKSDGWSAKPPRRVFLDDDIIYLIGFRCVRAFHFWIYKLCCSDKKRRKASFNAWDQGVIARLDSYVTNAFPFVLSRKSGVVKTLVARLADDLINGKGFSATSKFTREAYMNSYMTKYHSYVSLVNRCRSSIGAQLRDAAGEGASAIPAFGGFADRQGFNGAWPSDAYLRDVWHKWLHDTPVIQDYGIRMTREEYLQRAGQLVDGMILAGDASFKYAKVIRLTSAEQSKKTKPIQGIFMILNEYEQASDVVFQKGMRTASVHDLKSDLKNLFINRYRGHGFKLPVIFFSDECCEDRAMFEAMFREIEQETNVRMF